MTGHLSELNVYPLKGARGIRVERWTVDTFGLRWDRRWMVVDLDGVAITQRDRPELALVRPCLEHDHLALHAPGLTSAALPLHPDGAACQVVIWKDTVKGAVDAGDDAAAWISAALGASCRVVHIPEDAVRPVNPRYGAPGDRVSFADAYPFLLISQAALDELNRRLQQPIPMNRFRPNLVVDGVAAHAEDGWKRITIGSIPLDVVKPCARCAVPTIDQDTAQRGKEPIRTLATYRRIGNDVFFGQNLIHRGVGEMRVGDPVDVPLT